MPSRAQWIALGAVTAVVLAADQVTKAVVRSRLAFGESADAIGPLSIHHTRNSGVLGGHLQGSALVLGIATTIVIAAMIVYFARRGGSRPVFTVAFALVLGGSLGNLVDRLRLGYVTDFLDRGNGGVFNLADAAITLGILLIVIGSLLGGRSEESAPRPGAHASQRD